MGHPTLEAVLSQLAMQTTGYLLNFPIPVELPKWFPFLQIHFYNLIDETKRELRFGSQRLMFKSLAQRRTMTPYLGVLCPLLFPHWKHWAAGPETPAQPSPYAGAEGGCPVPCHPPKMCRAQHRRLCSLLPPKVDSASAS